MYIMSLFFPKKYHSQCQVVIFHIRYLLSFSSGMLLGRTNRPIFCIHFPRNIIENAKPFSILDINPILTYSILRNLYQQALQAEGPCEPI